MFAACSNLPMPYLKTQKRDDCGSGIKIMVTARTALFNSLDHVADLAWAI